MRWIKTWAKLEDEAYYLVIRTARLGEGLDYFNESFHRPQVVRGSDLKTMLEGYYIATPFVVPASLAECE